VKEIPTMFVGEFCLLFSLALPWLIFGGVVAHAAMPASVSSGLLGLSGKTLAVGSDHDTGMMR
jgi:hypothetical protein